MVNLKAFITTSLKHEFSLPLDNNTVGLYISHLHLYGLKPSTIQNHLSAVSYIHKIKDIYDPTQCFLVSKLMKSLHKLSPSVDTRLPVSHDLLKKIIVCLSSFCKSRYEMVMYTAMFSFAYYACLRVGEYAIANSDKNVLAIDQLTTISKKGKVCALRVKFRNFKHCTDAQNIPVLEINMQDDITCPVTSMGKYLEVRPHCPGPIFIDENMSTVSSAKFQKLMQSCISFLNLDKKRYTTHSLRIGRCTDMVLQGYSEAQIRSVGRWKSDAYKRYIRPSIISL